MSSNSSIAGKSDREENRTKLDLSPYRRDFKEYRKALNKCVNKKTTRETRTKRRNELGKRINKLLEQIKSIQDLDRQKAAQAYYYQAIRPIIVRCLELIPWEQQVQEIAQEEPFWEEVGEMEPVKNMGPSGQGGAVGGAGETAQA